jgi:hypothetical protein
MKVERFATVGDLFQQSGSWERPALDGNAHERELSVLRLIKQGTAVRQPLLSSSRPQLKHRPML